ncbi:MAG TPA: glucokinase [Chitinophagaceae bacterium]|nr:glucokinase [Chitinophagaceae bacterium]
MPKKPLLPLAFLSSFKKTDAPITILAGDAGGTKTNLALFRASAEGIVMLREARYASQEYTSLADIIVQFTGKEWPNRICIAVAGPVTDGRVQLTNLSWKLDSKAMSAALKTPVSFINDLEANSYGLAGLQPTELALIHTSKTSTTGNIAIIAPGTGLGEAGMYFDGSKYHPFATEGGHSDFSPRTEQDIDLFRFLQQKYGHVSWERVLSGPGIHTIFSFLTTVERKAIPDWLQDQLQEGDPTPVISNAAIHQQEPVCLEAMQLFVRYLAMEAASLCLKLKSTGGCYISGGIPPKILPLLQTGEFYQHFLDMGRMQPLLAQMPVYVVLNDKSALLGAAYYGAYNMN